MTSGYFACTYFFFRPLLPTVVFLNICILNKFSLVAQMAKSMPAKRETWVQSLGCEDPLEKEMAPHSSTLAWKIPWTEERGGLQSMGSQRVGHDGAINK